MARINIDLDENLVEEVMRRDHLGTKREAVHFALQRLVGDTMTLAEALAMRGIGWEDAFTILALPSGVHLTLVPDCEHTNLLEGRLPPNASALAMKPSSPDEWLACHAPEHDFPADHGLARRGIISYYAAQTLPVARTMDEWLQEIQRAMSVDLASGVLPRLKQPLLQVLGIPTARLPGHVAM